MNQEDKSYSSSDKEKNKQVNERVSVSEEVTFKLERVKELLKEADEREKRVEVLESQRKKDEESLKEIKRRYNII